MEEVVHKRRKRYSGKYPKHFDEKYKEHNLEKYQDIKDHVISKGNTPAGTHISIMVNEILEFLDIQPGEIGLDATLGYGGHTRKMMEKLEGQGHLYGLDVDPIEQEKTTKRLRDAGFDQTIFTPILTNFKNIDEVSKEYGKFDFILADLGVSSMQIDDPKRGFSFRSDGPLDFRMNPLQGQPLKDLLPNYTKEELENIFVENSDEPYASEIARTIYSFLRSGAPIQTTMQLRKVIEKALVGKPKDEIKKSLTRCFQALRIEVNQEIAVLDEFLDKLPTVLKPGGKVAILTFHSGEDRLVKKSMKEFYNLGIYSSYSRDVTRPTADECFKNPRAKSTKMRWAIRSNQEIEK